MFLAELTGTTEEEKKENMYLTEKEQRKDEEGKSLTELTELTEPTEKNVGFISFRKLKKIKSTLCSSCSSSVHSVNSSESRSSENRDERVRDSFFSVFTVRDFSSSLSPRAARGFSLLEVLVAMSVLVVMIMMVTNMFRNASEAWDLGTSRAEMNTAARAAMDYITRELSQAVAGEVQDANGNIKFIRSFTLSGGNNLRFTALAGTNGTLRGSLFQFDQLERRIQADNDASDPYTALPGVAWVGIADKCLITNVWSFSVAVYSNAGQMAAGGGGSAYNSSLPANSNMLPVCVDISMELLGETEMARAMSLPPSSPAQDGYVVTNARVYTARVYFPNRMGMGK